MISHLVLFNSKPGLADGELKAFAKSIGEACQQIPSIHGSRIGKRLDIDAGYARGFGEKTYQYVAIFDFEDASALKQYLTHPLHQHLGRLFWDTCESTIVVEAVMYDGKADGLVEFLLDDQ
jgi:hypothetical protein